MRHSTSIEPPSATLELITSNHTAATAAAADLSPISLLWAHQLRREHKALVARMDQLETKFTSTAKNTENMIQSVMTRLDGFDTRVDGVSGGIEEISEIKRSIEELSAWREEDENGRHEKEERERGRDAEWEEKLKGDIREEISGLEGMVRELREKVESGVAPAFPRPLAINLRDGGTPPSAQPVHQNTRRNKDTGIPSTVSGTPSTTRQNSQEVHDGPPSVSGSFAGFSEASTILARPPVSRITPELETQTSDLIPVPFQSESQATVSTLKQDGRPLQSYLELGESVVAKFPRRREARVVESFWEGLADAETKNAVEERMDRDGWTWSILRETITLLIPQPETEKSSGWNRKGELVRRRKKRRVIPIVWSAEGEDSGPLGII